MNQFDAVEYFNKRAQENPADTSVTLINEKAASLAAASAQKIQQMSETIAATKQQELANANSWVGKLGLDPKGIPGQAVNLGAHFISGAAHLAGDVGALVSSDIPSMIEQAGLSDSEKAAISRYYQGSATAADKILINNPSAATGGAATPLQMVERSAALRQRGQNIRESVNGAGSALVQADSQNAFGDQLRAGFDAPWQQTQDGWDALTQKHEAAGTLDLVAGLSKLVFNAGKAAGNNLDGVAGYMAENAPQLLLGAAGRAGKVAMTASNIGYASDYYQQGLQNYSQQHNGGLPDDATQLKMAAQAASLALAEHAGSLYELKHAMGAAHALEEVGKTGLVQGVKNVVKAVVHGGAEETLTEGYQGYMEGQVSQNPASAADIYENAVIGGVVGAGLTGGGRAVGEALQATPEHAAARAATAAEQASRAQAQASAIDTGDVAHLVDPKLPTYDPAGAIAALHANSTQPGTDEESQQANLAKAHSIVADLETRHEDAKASLEQSDPAQLAELKALAQAATDAGDTTQAKELNDAHDFLSTQDRKKLQRKVDDLKARVDAAHENMVRFHEDVGSVSDVNATIDTISAPVDETNTEAVAARSKAAESLINLSMASPGRLDTETATKLADDTANGLNDGQRDYLRKFSAARLAENALKDAGKVSQEIYAGSDKNIGIAQYRSRIGAAIAAGNQEFAQQQLAKLANFDQDHKAKAALVAQAQEQLQKSGRGVQVVRNQDTNSWEFNTGKTLSRSEMTANGGVTVHASTPPSILQGIPKEATAISAAHNELAAAYALKFSNAPKGSSNVQDVSQSHDQTQNQPVADAPVQAVGSAATSTVGSGVQPAAAVATVERSDVQAPGVAPAPLARDVQLNPQSTAVDSGNLQASPDAAVAGRTEGQLQSNNSTTEAQLSSTESSGAENSSQSAEQTSVQGQETAAQPAGQLAAMRQKSAEGATATTRNLLADFFTQSASREGDRTQRPLVSTQNFLSTAFDLGKLATTAGLESLTEAQHNTLQHFQTLAKEWLPKITANLELKKNAEFKFEDLMQFMMEPPEHGADVEENVKTAIAYAAFAYVSDNATKSALNSPEEINAILGRDENDVPSEDDIKAVGHIGVRQNVVINGLGQKIAQALGLTANADAPLDLQPRLHSALGARAMALLVQTGMATVSTINGVDMAILRGETLPDDSAKLEALSRVEHPFLQLARTDWDLHPTAQAIFEATRGSQSVLDKVFGAEAGLKDPVFDASEIAHQRSIRNTRQKVPSTLDKIVEHENQQPNHLRQDMWHLVGGLADNVVLRIAGWVDTSAETMHKANRASQQAKNDGLARELGNVKDFVDHVWQAKGLDTPIFFEHSVWKQQRVGIANNTVNPQTSKIHRHMLFRPDWVTKVDPTNAKQWDNFRLRVLEGLGVKTDKQANEKSLGDWGKVVSDNAKVQAAVAAIKARMAGADLTDVQQEAIASAAKSMHALDALVALAKVDGSTPFETHLMGEVDGVTNGPMLTHMLMGAADTIDGLFERANKGGFFQVGSSQENYNVWRGEGGNNDLYESTVRKMLGAVQDLVRSAPGKQKLLDTIQSFTGTLMANGSVEKAGRDIVKTPLTAMMFGAAVEKSTNGMAMKFIDNIYSKIEDGAKSGDQTKVKDLVDRINRVLAAGGAPLVTAAAFADLMEHQFTKGQVHGLLRAFNDTLGKPMQDTMKSEFENFINKRRVFNQGAQLAFELHNAVYTALRDQFVEELRAKGELPTRTTQKGAVETLHDLTAAQEGELRKRLAKVAPVLATQFSSESGSLASALAVSKSGRKLSQNATYSQNIKFGEKVAGNGSVKTHGYEVRETNPGVAMLPMSIHSTDSFISHTAAMQSQVLNIHDAHGAGVGMFEKVARNLNQATWNALLEYSPASQMAETLSRTVQGLAEVLQQPDLPPSVKTNLMSALQTMSEKMGKQGPPAEHVVATVMENVRFLAQQADDMKLQALSQMGSIDQYALEGGQYSVTEEDRAEAAKRREALVKGLSEQENSAIDAISNALASGPASSPAVEEQISEDMEDKPVQPSVFGPVGQSNVQSDPALVDFFRANPNATVRQLIQHVYGTLDSSRRGAFDGKLLKVLAKTVSPDLTVHMVTPGTQESDVLAPPKDAARGWFVSREGRSAIYFLSPEFQTSGLTNETVIHELTHGALAQIVDRELARKGAPGYKSEALDLVNELEALRTKAAAYAKQQGIKGFAPALGDIQEFIAYGMTNPAFQRQVLSQISMESKTGGNSLVNGMKKFISNLVGLLFNGSTKDDQAQAVNGMTTLISNVSGLLNQAATERNRTESYSEEAAHNLSMATNPVGVVNTYSTLDIHDALPAGNITPEFDDKLRNLLDGIVEQLHGPFGTLKRSLMENQALTPFDVWQKALDTGVLPFAASTQVAPMVISEREAFAMDQVEVTVREALARHDASATQAYRELNRLYAEMRETLTAADFNSQAEYDFIFAVAPGADGRSEHLARFAAFGLANQQFNTIMGQKQTAPTRKIRDGKTFAQRVVILFEQILEFLHGDLALSYGGQGASSKLSQLVGKLVDVEAKRRLSLIPQGSMIRSLDNVVSKIDASTRAAINKLAGSEIVRDSTNQFVRTLGAVSRLTANRQVMGLMDAIGDMRNKYVDGTYGVMAGILNDVRGPGKLLNALQLGATFQQKTRMEIISHTAKFVLAAFDNGAAMSKDVKAAVSAVFLRTGMHTLIDTGRFNMTELEHLMGSKQAQAAAINTLESQLVGHRALLDHMIHQANALAYFKVTGRVTSKALMLNAHNIANMFGTKYVGRLTEAQIKANTAIIEQLVPLYAMESIKAPVMAKALDTLRSENQRSGGKNGVQFILALHKRMEQESSARLFDGQEALMMHGYTSEITNPYVEVVTANAKDGEKLEWKGYTKGAEVAVDPADPNQEVKHMYVLKGGGLAPYVTGSMLTTGRSSKGRTVEYGTNAITGQTSMSTKEDITKDRLRDPLASGPRRKLSEKDKTYMAPIVNAQGEIVDWRYMMREDTRDSILERDNEFDHIMGALAGSIYDKETTPENNAKVVAALKDVYDAQKGTNSASFVRVGPNSTDPQLRETWRLLPDETKQEVIRVWGQAGMLVRKDAVTTVFGYRKMSLADAFEKDPALRNELEKVFVWTIQNALSLYGRVQKGMSEQEAINYAQRAALLVTRGDRVWQELVHEVKNIIVVKSVVVMWSNIRDNMSLLLLHGVSPMALIKNHLVALRGARDYQAHTEELAALQAQVDTKQTHGKGAEISHRIAILKDAIARNPVRELIEAGLMPTIAEDLVSLSDQYSYKGELTEAVDNVASNLNPTVVKIAKNVWQTKDTYVYQSLSRITQLSDFVARYTLYQHLTTREKSPLSKEDAIFEASESFINYDVPMHRGLQFMDDRGILPFIKYFLRIQRVLGRLAKENPGRVLSTVALHQFGGLGPTVLGSSWITRIGNNPFSWGALSLPSVIGDLPAVAGAMRLLK